MTAYRIIDDHNELENIGTLSHDALDEHVTNTPFLILSGSYDLSKLPPTTRLLAAGPGVTITDGGPKGDLIISATGGGGGSGGTIGDAEDGSYEDGLFTDFTPTTPVGITIDRFNEVLLALAPPPAPNLSNFNCENTGGSTAFLSFGASNNLGGGAPAYASSGITAGFTAVDVNGSYGPATSGDNIRKGIYRGATIINGILNNNVVAYLHNTNVVNYTAKSFGNGNAGELRLIVNGNVVHSISLTSPSIGVGNPGSGTGSHLNSNGSGFTNLSIAGSGKLSTGAEFFAFKHRTGKYQIGTADQRRGWNYARVVHVVGAASYTTNYVEWINDDDSSNLSAGNGGLIFVGVGSTKLSGVEYFKSANLSYSVRITNLYKYVYDLNPITLTATHTNVAVPTQGISYSFPAQSKSTINTAGGEDHTKALNISSNTSLTADFFLGGSIEVGINVTHPLKNPITNGGRYTVSQILLYNLTNTSTALMETFRAEPYRLQAGSYDLQGDVTNPSNAWDSSVHMVSSNAGYSDGLQFYNQLLLSPKNTLNGGNFLGLTNGPTGNPNYSTATGTRTFYRWFLNSTGASQYDLSLYLNGSSTIVDATTALNTSRIRILVKIPGKTGWMDVALPYVFGASYADGAGLHTSNGILGFTSTLAGTNYLNLGNLEIAAGEYIVVRIEADPSWTGYVSLMSVQFGAGTGTLTPVPDLYNIDAEPLGSSAVLSFGAARSITDYTNPGTTAGFSATDLNQLYAPGTSGANLRRGIFTTIQNIVGDLNDAAGSPGRDYVARAFSDANTGIIKLEVNGSIVHTLDLSTYTGAGSPGAGTASSLNAQGSGFTSVSTWGPGMFDNGVPRYSEIQRTARYLVSAAQQRLGWNYVRVIHTVGTTDRITNYAEWLNIVEATPLASSANSLSTFEDDAYTYVSGVKYFTSPYGRISTTISNLYRNVYTNSATAVSFTSLTNATAASIVQTGTGITATKTTNSSVASLQALAATTDSHLADTTFVGTINFTQPKSLPGSHPSIATTAYSCGGAMVFTHPFKASLTIPVQSKSNFLVWSPTNAGSNEATDGYFQGEVYRVIDKPTYENQAVVIASYNAWNSEASMNDPAGYPEHSTGLLVYDRVLMAPKYGGASGDFRNPDDGGTIQSPAGNVNYSNLVATNRTYLRYFRNNTSNDRPSIAIRLYGDATIVAKTGTINAGTLGANKNIHVHVCLPGKTGFLDLGRPSAGTGNYNDDDGCLFGDIISTITAAGTKNTCTFNGRTVDGTSSPSAQRIIVRITAHKDWIGYIERINISWSGA